MVHDLNLNYRLRLMTRVKEKFSFKVIFVNVNECKNNINIGGRLLCYANFARLYAKQKYFVRSGLVAVGNVNLRDSQIPWVFTRKAELLTTVE